MVENFAVTAENGGRMSHEAIVEFLVKRFTAEDLRRFIGFKYPEVAVTLPGASASPVVVAHAIVDVLGRHGQLDAAFFAYARHGMGKRPAGAQAGSPRTGR